MNPIALLQSLPPAARAAVYCVAWLGGLVYGAYQASHGDWHATELAVIPVALGALAHANTQVTSGSAPAQIEGD